MRTRHWFYAFVIFFALAFSAYLLNETISEKNGQMWHVAPFLGSVLITVGWIVTSETAIRNSRKQHTIGMINQHRFGSTRKENIDTIQKYLPKYNDKMTRDIVDFEDERHELLHAIDRELNFYDFAAAAVMSDDVDEALLQACLHGQMLNICDQAQEYMEHWRSKNKLTWCYVVAMRDRWKGNPPREMKL